MAAEEAHRSGLPERYQILEKLGAGGMGVVYRARDVTLGRYVAIKSLPTATTTDARARARLIREARAAATLEHPSIAHVYDVIDSVAGVHVVMELVRGQTLRECLAHGPLPPALVGPMVCEIASALDVAHRAGVVHRDVKPDNVMQREDGRVVVLDFGLAIERTGALDRTLPLDASPKLTESGLVVGTTYYLAPEQARGEAVPESDQFALAATAFELLTGRPPWVGESATYVLAQILVDAPPRASELMPTLAPSVDDVLARALEKSPAARFASITLFADALSAALAGRGAAEAASRSSTSSAVPPSAPSVPSSTSHDAPPIRAAARFRLALVIVLATVVLVAAVLVAVRPVPSPLLLPEAVVACPIFEVRGLPAPSGWLGAAAATIACRRITIARGNTDTTQLVPAALLDLPQVPEGAVPTDPFDALDAVARSLAAGRARASAWVEGTLTTSDRGRFTATITLRWDGGGSAPAEGTGSTPSTAVEAAVDALVALGVVAHPEQTQPELARWSGFTRTDALRIYDDLNDTAVAGVDVEARCRALADHLTDLPAHLRALATSACNLYRPMHVEAASLDLDRSSPGALARSAPSWASGRDASEVDAVVLELDRLRREEASDIGRATIADALAQIALGRGDREDALAHWILALRATPLVWDYRVRVLRLEVGRSGNDDSRRVAQMWSVDIADVWRQPGAAEPTLESVERPYVLATDGPIYGIERAFYAIQHGDMAAARSVQSRYAAGAPHEHFGGQCIAALLEVQDHHPRAAFDRLTRAIASLDRLGSVVLGDGACLSLHMTLGEVLGREHEVARAWLSRFVLGATPRVVEARPHAELLTVILAMRAEPEDARRALAVIRALRAAGTIAAVGHAFVDDVERGLDLRLAGDEAGAVDAWRPAIGSRIALPADAFDRQGYAALASRIDAPNVASTLFAGAHPASAREAERALARGDIVRARELARRVVDAWETADDPGPWVPRMRAILSTVEAPAP